MGAVSPAGERPGETIESTQASTATRASMLNRVLPIVRPLLPLITLCIIFTVINTEFLATSNLRGILEQNVVIIVAATGATFVVAMGSIDLSVEGVILASSVVVALLVQNDATSANFGVLGVVVGCLVGMLFGLTNGILTAYGRIPSFAVTLGTWYIGIGMQTVLQSHFAQSGVMIHDPMIMGLVMQNKWGFSTLVFLALGIVIIGFVIQQFTMLGRRAYAVGGNETIARMSGVHVARVKVLVFALAGTLYGFAGFLSVSRFGGLGSGVSSGSILFTVITAIVVGGTPLAGGRGGVWHSLLGVLTLGVLTNGLVLSGVPPFYQSIVQGALIVVALGVGAWQTTMKTREIVK